MDMKARMKESGEIVTLAPYARIALDQCDSWGNPVEVAPEEIELVQDSDWQAFRAEAAKDILCAILNGGTASGMIGLVAEKESIVKRAMEIADELINQLKEE